MKKIIFGILAAIIIVGTVYWFAFRPQAGGLAGETVTPTEDTFATFSP